MRRPSLSVSLLLVLSPARAQDTRPAGRQPDGTTLTTTEQVLTPAGHQVEFGGRPTDLVALPGGRTIAVKNRNDLLLVDVAARKVAHRLAVPTHGLSFHGIASNAEGTRVYVTGSHRQLWVAQLDAAGGPRWEEPIPLPGPKGQGNSAPGGVALDGEQLLVCLSRNNALGVVDLATRKLVREIPVGVAPYAVRVHGRKAYVTNWGGRRPDAGDKSDPSSGTPVEVDEHDVAKSGTVSIVDLAAGKEIAQVETGRHPSDMALDAQRGLLYVANANSDSVAVVDLRDHDVVARFSTRPDPNLPFGSSPNALALSRDGTRLFVANGTNNAVAVVDTKARRVLGFLPVGWYPGALLLDEERGWLAVANVKGLDTRRATSRPGFSATSYAGSLTLLTDWSDQALLAGTQAVRRNNRVSQLDLLLEPPRADRKPVPLPERHGEPSLLEHVIYVIKENRTYDQVLGDLPGGNGDASLCIFGREITPNQHALAEQFALLDNFYCSGAISADGHQWTDEAFVTDYIEKQFGGFVRSYPFDGDDPLAYASSGFLWDNALARGKTFRCYGEMVLATIEPKGATFADIWADFSTGGNKFKVTASSAIDAVQRNLCPTYIGFPSVVPDVWRAREFIKELKQFEARGTFPNLVMMLLPNDHTAGTRPGMPTPAAAVADNDLALGQIIEAVTHSRFWKNTCILVVEDDPQAGWDHVDGHRTIAFCISPYTKRKQTVSTRYTQVGMVKTVELMLGLPPMNQFDLVATAMHDCFTEKADLTPFTAIKNKIPLDQLNVGLDRLKGPALRDALASLELDLDEVDRADEDTFNRILWHAMKGHDVPYPAHLAGGRGR